MVLEPRLLKDARAAAGLTQAELAKRLGISQPEIARLESRRANPRLRTLRRAIEATGHQIEAEIRPISSGIDETMIIANRRLSPGQRLQAFQQAYKSITGLVHAARSGNGP